MRLPFMNSTGAKNKRQIIDFRGINYSPMGGEGELEESYNLSSEHYPWVSQRAGRKTEAVYLSPTGLYARGKLCVVDGEDFRYGGEIVGKVERGEKHFATINTKIVIFPDKKFYDTHTGEFGSLEARYHCYAGDVSFTGTTLTVREKSYIDVAAPEEERQSLDIPATDTITVYTGVTHNKDTGALSFTGGAQKSVSELAKGNIIQYECESNEYQIVEGVSSGGDTYSVNVQLRQIVLHNYPNFDTAFSIGDAVDLSGCVTLSGNNGSHIIRGISGRTLTFDRDAFGQTGAESGAVRLERTVPNLTCICECDNRIWGAEGTTIYARALGDPKNFYVYDGLATDSYAVAVGTEGDFTACCAYSSTVLFWKENCLHKILGRYPAQYELYTYHVPGVQEGSEKSLCLISETIFYKGRDGIYAYSGGIPDNIGECFGPRRFSRAVGGSDGRRYYLSMLTGNGAWELYVFDTAKGIWLREDETHATDFAYLDGTLYYLDGRNGKVIRTGQDREEEGRIEWALTFCRFNETTLGRKGYSRLYLRVELEAGAWLKAEVSPDGAPFRQVYLTHNEHARTMQIPILPTRCDSFLVRLSGKGECKIKSMVREFAVGSEY